MRAAILTLAFLASPCLAQDVGPPNKEDRQELRDKIGGLVRSFETGGWSDERQAEARQVAKIQAELYAACVADERDRLKESREPLQSVIVAIFAGCMADETLFVRAAAASFRGTADPTERREMAKRIGGNVRGKLESALTQFLVEHRMDQ